MACAPHYIFNLDHPEWGLGRISFGPSHVTASLGAILFKYVYRGPHFGCQLDAGQVGRQSNDFPPLNLLFVQVPVLTSPCFLLNFNLWASSLSFSLNPFRSPIVPPPPPEEAMTSDSLAVLVQYFRQHVEIEFWVDWSLHQVGQSHVCSDPVFVPGLPRARRIACSLMACPGTITAFVVHNRSQARTWPA